jgi:hypothetical protein
MTPLLLPPAAAPCSAARDFVEENKVAAVAAAARRPVKAEAKSAGGAAEYLHKSEYGQVCVINASPAPCVTVPGLSFHGLGLPQCILRYACCDKHN